MSIDVCKAQILSEEYCDFIVSELQTGDFFNMFTKEICEQRMGPFYKSIYVEKEQAEPIAFERYPYHSIPKCYTLLDMQALEETGIIQIQNYPTLELQGSGVLIGFVDTGIDYQNPVFRNLDGTTRIVGLWDQTIQEGNPPEGFLYGTEYNEVQINEALRSSMAYEMVPSRDELNHGTFVASIAAGGGDAENQFLGAAPEAKLAVVKLKPAKRYLKEFYLIETEAPCYQENDIMLGVTYLEQLAEKLNLPLVICIALGTNQGSHSASSPLAGLLEIYGSQNQRAVVIAGGNEGNQRHHYFGQLKGLGEIDEVEIRVDEQTNGFSLELWTEALNLLAVSIVSPSGEQTYQFPLRSVRTESYTFVLERTTVTVDYKVFAERLDAELVFLRFVRPTAGVWKVRVKGIQVEDGSFHMWLPMKEFLQGETYFLQPNPNDTITEPGSTISGMTVAFYKGDDNSIAIQSGRGYTRSNRIKPDLAAPGVNVIGAASRNRFVTRTGSSIAAGIASGAAALMLEWVVYQLQQKDVDSTQIRNLLVLGTEKTPGIEYPNREWGYGRLNVYQTFETISRI